MPRREPPTRAEVPVVAGILDADEVLATAHRIADAQEPSGAITWPDGHVDVWDHVECVMALSTCGLTEAARLGYEWLRRTQRADGSWPRTITAGRVVDAAAESNHAAYVAVGVWHEVLVSGDDVFAATMWPTVRRAIEWVLDLQAPSGQIAWERNATGAPGDHALLTGCSSIHQSLRCAIDLAEHVGDPQPDWELAADQLGHAVARHPEVFADKNRFAMDWYYPVLGGALRGREAMDRLAAGWAAFVVPGLGVRCVSDQPWVTGAETCELVLALDAVGERSAALELFAAVQHLRHRDGGYWTGWQYADRRHFPAERAAWTAAAVILAADALSDTTGGAGVFRDAAGRSGTAADPAACGCVQPATGS